MKDRRSGDATKAWAFLQVLARMGGTLGSLGHETVDDHKKQKQILAKQLIQSFGITADPIRWYAKGREYKTVFVLRDERPKAVREGGRRR